VRQGSANSILDEIRRIEDVPGFVYLIRNKDLYKIGITISLERRLKELKPDEVVAVKEAANMKGIEKLLHKRYKHNRLPQTEYFRLTGDEVQEAIFLLGGENSASYSPSIDTQTESESIASVALKRERLRLSPRIKEMLDDLEDLLVGNLNIDAIYEENHDSYTDVTGGIPEIIYYTDNADPSLKVPVSNELRQACYRVMSRADVFLPVVQADSELDAANEIERITCDFALIYLWGIKEGVFNVSLTEGSSSASYSRMLLELEKLCIRKNVWYTTRASLNPYWLLLGFALVSCFVYPPLGIPVTLILVVFQRKLRSSFRIN